MQVYIHIYTSLSATYGSAANGAGAVVQEQDAQSVARTEERKETEQYSPRPSLVREHSARQVSMRMRVNQGFATDTVMACWIAWFVAARVV